MRLEEFVRFDDSVNFSEKQDEGIAGCMKNADLVIPNNGTLDAFLKQVDSMNFVDDALLRPKWDTYFMQIALLVAKRSNCFRRAVGAVLTKEHRIVATGYNGTPFGIENCNRAGCPRCVGAKVVGKDLDKCVCIHAEENAVIEAGRSNAKGCTVYTTTFPCLFCTKALIQAGVTKLVYYKEYDMDLPFQMFKDAGVDVQRVIPFVLGPVLKL